VVIAVPIAPAPPVTTAIRPRSESSPAVPADGIEISRVLST
jgi:hypothetical protein